MALLINAWNASQMLTVFFRYDDYSSLSNSLVDRGLIQVFRRQGVVCTFGVVPAMTSVYPEVEARVQSELPLPPEKAAELREAVGVGAVELALHGWRHLSNELYGHPDPSEFRGLSLEAQQEILQRGSDRLAEMVGVRPTIFIPPWNSYDQDTVRALDAVGMTAISANRYSSSPPITTKLKFAPITTEIGSMRAAVGRARRSGENGALVGVMMHPYDFRESADDRAVTSLPEFERDLAWLKSMADVRLGSIAEITSNGSMGRVRWLANRPSFLESAYPGFIEPVYADPIYHSSAVAARKKRVRDGRFAGFLFGIAIFGWLLTILVEHVMAGWYPPAIDLIPLVGGLCVALILGRLVRKRALYCRGAAVLALLCGSLAAAIT